VGASDRKLLRQDLGKIKEFKRIALLADKLRGPQHSLAWCDELAKWRYAQETWDMLQFGLRLGARPQAIIATTPRPIPVLKQIIRKTGRISRKAF
jgi:phage terminase large subunit-like protein